MSGTKFEWPNICETILTSTTLSRPGDFRYAVTILHHGGTGSLTLSCALIRDLSPVLGELFRSALKSLELMGRLATGTGLEGEDYKLLPHGDPRPNLAPLEGETNLSPIVSVVSAW